MSSTTFEIVQNVSDDERVIHQWAASPNVVLYWGDVPSQKVRDSVLATVLGTFVRQDMVVLREKAKVIGSEEERNRREELRAIRRELLELCKETAG